jgi:allophanate hydrolase subunit 1
LMGITWHKTVPWWKAHPARGPLMLQDHGDLVRFRNIWARELADYDE